MKHRSSSSAPGKAASRERMPASPMFSNASRQCLRSLSSRQPCSIRPVDLSSPIRPRTLTRAIRRSRSGVSIDVISPSRKGVPASSLSRASTARAACSTGSRSLTFIKASTAASREFRTFSLSPSINSGTASRSPIDPRQSNTAFFRRFSPARGLITSIGTGIPILPKASRIV